MMRTASFNPVMTPGASRCSRWARLLSLACCLSVRLSAATGTGHATETGHPPTASPSAQAAYVASDPPLWNDLGTLHYPVSTRSALAQSYFDQGLRLTYAFNHLEAQRAFRMAQKLDPKCAMCFWGEALVLGPNINAPMDATATGPAWSAIVGARSLGKTASAKERALIDALSMRYAHRPQPDRKDLDDAYATAMGRIARRFPEDDEVATLYAESLMDLSPWDYWQEDGRHPRGRTMEILGVLERTLARKPEHPGAIHYYIHMVEASDRPERATPFAERLPRLMPGAGHLVHMPGHVYYRLGRYRDALEANRAAIAVDEDYLQETGARGIYAEGYYPHNLHFLMASAQMAGDGTTALAAADKLAGLVSEEIARTVPWTQPVKAAPYFAHAQFSRREAVLKLADPGPNLPYVRAMWHYVRGVVSAQAGTQEEARNELDALTLIEQTADFGAMTTAGVPAPDLLRIAAETLAARIAQAQNDPAAAIAAFSRAVALQDRLPYMEPPFWYYPARRSLGSVRFLMGDPESAETEFLRSLNQTPNDAWTLWGLAEVYRALGDARQLAETERRFRRAIAADHGVQISMARL